MDRRSLARVPCPPMEAPWLVPRPTKSTKSSHGPLSHCRWSSWFLSLPPGRAQLRNLGRFESRKEVSTLSSCPFCSSAGQRIEGMGSVSTALDECGCWHCSVCLLGFACTTATSPLQSNVSLGSSWAHWVKSWWGCASVCPLRGPWAPGSIAFCP